jgi:hypothetical protein
MNPPADKLFQLLPYHYRDLDAKQSGGALRDLLRVLEEQFDVVEQDIAQMYEDWFIETCADWAVPYLGDLAGWQQVQGAGAPGAGASAADVALLRWLAPRRDVANTLRHRRRKGTLALLAELSRDVAGWPALAVEAGFQSWLLAPPAELHRHRGAANAPQEGPVPLTDVHDPQRLQWLGAPFDTLAHSIDVRRTANAAQPALNLPSVALHVWRLQSFPITLTPAGDNPSDPESFRFSVLGNDTPLFTAPGGTGRLSMPRPLTLAEIKERVTGDGPPWCASADYYGPGKSFAIYAPDWPVPGAPQPVPRERIIPADLSGWHREAIPAEGFIAVDPVLGRLAFPEGRGPDSEKGVELSWHTGFSAPMGGGEYLRPLAQAEHAVIYRLGKGSSLQDGLDLWKPGRATVKDAIIEFEASGVYNGYVHIRLKSDETLQIRAAQGVRPILELKKPTGQGAGTLLVEMEPGAKLVIDGIIISDGYVLLRGPAKVKTGAAADEPECPAAVVIRHCTLVPGWSFRSDCSMASPDKDSIKLKKFPGSLTIQRSITGSIGVNADEAGTDPVPVDISDSIVDSASCNQSAFYDDNFSPAAQDEGMWAHIALTIHRSTVFGAVHVHMLPLASDTIFTGTVCVARRQPGCIRFCWVKPGGRMPRRYECQPEKAMGAKSAGCGKGALDCQAAEALRVIRPRFVSERYGHPAYAQLLTDTPDEIRRGADDRAEMGAFHDLFQPQREANLRARLAEYTPAGCEAALIFQT